MKDGLATSFCNKGNVGRKKVCDCVCACVFVYVCVYTPTDGLIHITRDSCAGLRRSLPMALLSGGNMSSMKRTRLFRQYCFSCWKFWLKNDSYFVSLLLFRMFMQAPGVDMLLTAELCL